MSLKSVFLLLFITLAFHNPAISIGQEAPPAFDWQKTIGGSLYDAASKIISSVDGGYILVGYTYSSDCDVHGNHGGGDAWVVKIDASGNKQWQKTLGGSNVDGAMAAVEFPDGKIFIAANTNSSNGDVVLNHGKSDMWIICLDASGQLVWQKTYGGSEDDYAKALIKTSDDHLLIAGNSQSFNGDMTSNNGSDDYWLAKIDTNGIAVWKKSFGGSASDMCNAVAETNDGGFVAVGSSNSSDGDVTGNHGNNDFWVMKTDVNGNLQWQKSLGGSLNESAMSVIKNTDGNIVMVGYVNSNDGDVTDNKGGSDYWMVILDPAGALVQQATYGGSNSDVAYSVVQEADGGYLLAGSTFSFDFDVPKAYGGEDFWLLKTDAAGTLKWSRTFGGSATDRNKSTLQTADGGCIMAGYTYSNNQQVGGNHGGSDMWVAKLSCMTPVSAFTFADDTVCINSTLSLSNASTNSAAYSWLSNGIAFGNNDDAAIQYSSAGTYSISLVAATCYSKDTLSHIFTVIDHPVLQITSGKSYLCDGESITLSTPDDGHLLWNTGDTTGSIQISAGGDYWVTTNAHQCSGTSALLNVPKYALPQFSLGNDTSFCFGNVFTVRAPSGYQSYIWQDGSNNAYYDATNGGDYSVTVSNGHCSSTDSINLIAKTDCIFPIAEFSTGKRTICPATCISFQNLSANATAWSWSFQGATPASSTDQNPPSVCYNTPGTYSVSLTVSNVNGSVTQMQLNYIVVSDYPAVPVVTLSGFVLESTPALTYQWFSNGQPVAGATAHDYAADASGYYYVMTGNTSGCYSASDSVYFDVTGISGVNNNSKLEVYPNPANDQFTVSGLQLANDSKLEVYNDLGEIVYNTILNSKQEMANPPKDGSAVVNCKQFTPGVYLIHVASKVGNVFKKVIVRH